MTLLTLPRLRAFDSSVIAASRSDRDAASVLLAIVLLYGAGMLLWSGAPITYLWKIFDVFGAVAMNGALLILCAFGAAALVRPAILPAWKSRLFWVVVAAATVGLTFSFYGLFKQIVLPVRGFLWDATFAHVSRTLFGQSSWVFTHRFFGTVAGTRFLDQAYSIWMVLIFALPIFTPLIFGDERVRFRIILAWMLAWIVIGTFAAWFFASAGPCFYNQFVGHDASYSELSRRLAAIDREARASGHPILALQYQPALVAIFRSREFVPAAGISAMPSMHVALATLLAIAGFHRGKVMGALFALYALIIWIGSIHFGWHYFVDGPVAAAMMLGLWAATGFAARLLYPQPAPAD